MRSLGVLLTNPYASINRIRYKEFADCISAFRHPFGNIVNIIDWREV